MKRNYAESFTDPTTGLVGPQIPEVKTTSLRRSRLRRRTSNGNDGQFAKDNNRQQRTATQRILFILRIFLWIFYRCFYAFLWIIYGRN